MMVPRALLDGYTAQLNALSEAGRRLVLRALANARWRTVAELRRIMAEAMDQVCSVVADDAAVLASEMYDDVRELCLGERLGTVPEGSYDPAATAGAVRALVGSVAKTGGTERFGRELSARVDYEVKRAAGESVHRMGKRDPADVRFARIPSGVETCPFCLMLASRGFVYHSEGKAGGGGHYHANCDCRIVPGFGDTEVEGYDPMGLYERYRDCADALDEEWLWRAYSALPGAQRDGMPFDDFKAKQILAEMRTRDPLWLSKGVKPKVRFASPAVREDKLANHMDEVLSCIRLRKHGIDTLLAQDEVSYYDEARKMNQTRAYADLANGTELKVLKDTMSKNTINGYLKDTSRKKENAVAIIFDNFNNVALDDDALVSMLRGMRSFRKGKIYVLTKDERLVRAK